eukprot:9488110-Pyramimonas_sp.AAC.2
MHAGLRPIYARRLGWRWGPSGELSCDRISDAPGRLKRPPRPPQDGPRGPHVGSEMALEGAQDGQGRGARRPKTTPRKPNTGTTKRIFHTCDLTNSGCAQEAPNGPEEAPQRSLEAPEKLPRRSREAPRDPKTAP